MKRYTMITQPSGHVEPVENDDGEWVRWEDAYAVWGWRQITRHPDAPAMISRLFDGVASLPEQTWPSERRGLRVSEDER